jgi:hypothetical protein
MNDRALEFLDRWESDNVGAVPKGQREQEAMRLVVMCRDDAARAGIAITDLEDAAKGDLLQNMMEALEAADDEAAN